MIGDVIPLDTLKARWAWSELSSSRFRKKYLSLGDEAARLGELANSSTPFDSISDQDRSILISLLQNRRRGLLLDELCKVREYVCVEWTKSDLLNSWVIPAMSPNKDRCIKYCEFIQNDPHSIDGKDDWSDPRAEAKNWALDVPFLQVEPGIATKINDEYLLLDGYFRSIIFVRFGKEASRYKVWVPNQ